MPRIVPELNLPSPTTGLHSRLRTAFSFLAYCEAITNGRGRRGLRARDLVAGEIAARNAALELLRNCMTGKMIVDEAASEPVDGDSGSPAVEGSRFTLSPGRE